MIHYYGRQTGILYIVRDAVHFSKSWSEIVDCHFFHRDAVLDYNSSERLQPWLLLMCQHQKCSSVRLSSEILSMSCTSFFGKAVVFNCITLYFHSRRYRRRARYNEREYSIEVCICEFSALMSKSSVVLGNLLGFQTILSPFVFKTTQIRQIFHLQGHARLNLEGVIIFSIQLWIHYINNLNCIIFLFNLKIQRVWTSLQSFLFFCWSLHSVGMELDEEQFVICTGYL